MASCLRLPAGLTSRLPRAVEVARHNAPERAIATQEAFLRLAREHVELPEAREAGAPLGCPRSSRSAGIPFPSRKRQPAARSSPSPPRAKYPASRLVRAISRRFVSARGSDHELTSPIHAPENCPREWTRAQDDQHYNRCQIFPYKPERTPSQKQAVRSELSMDQAS